MAIPSITNNAPSSGHITWGAFNIQLNGVTYSVGGGSTNQRWVWWKYNNGAPTINAGADVPTTLVDDDLVLFANKNGIGVRVQSTNFVDGELLVDGSIFADALSTNLINSQHIVTAGLDAGVIKFGTMSGDRIGVNTLIGDRITANSIGVGKLTVASMDNLFPDPLFINTVLGSANSWSTGTGVSITTGTGATGGNALTMANSGSVSQSSAYPLDVPCIGGESFRLVGRIRQNGASIPLNGVRFRIASKDAAGVITNQYVYSPALAADTWHVFSGILTLPATAVSYTVYCRSETNNTAGTLYWDYVQMTRAANAELIVDGTVLAKHIKSDEITALQIKANTITANEIATDAITADEIAAGAVTATEIKANTITANEIATGAITADEIAAGAVTAEKVSAEIIVANEFYSQQGYIGQLQADQISSGYLDADLALLGRLGVGEIDINPTVGITIPSPKGDTILSATGLGSRFAGAVETDELTVDGGLTLNAANNAINGSLSLANVVVPPTVKASAANYWPYTTPTPADIFHLTDSHDGLSWVALHYPSGSIRKYNKVTGALEATYADEYWHHDYGAWSIARVGSYYYMVMLKQSTNEWWLCRISSTFGSFVAQTKIVGAANVTQPSCGPNLINGRVIVIYAATGTGGEMRYMEFDTGGVQQVTELWDSTFSGTKRVANGNWTFGVVRGNIGPAGEEQLLTNIQYTPYFWNVTTKQIQWWPAYPEGPKGVCVEYGSTNKLRFVGFNTYRVYEWVRETNWPADNTIDISYAWYDSKTAGTGKHETTPSPTLVFSGTTRWAGVQIDTPAVSNTGQDDSPDSVAIYIEGKRQADVPVGSASNKFRSYLTTGAAPKATNEFAGASSYPGSIISAATFTDGVTPRFRLKGDGTGHWGDLVVDGNGKAVIGGDTGWIEVVNFTNLWENYGGSWPTVAYRKIGNRVFLRGLIRTPSGAMAIPASPFTLPEGFRPIRDTMCTAVFEKSQRNIDATGDGSKDTGSKGTGTSGTSHFHSISAYDISSNIQVAGVAARLDIYATGVIQVVHTDFDRPIWISFDSTWFWLD